MILDELVTNAVKHAYPPPAEGVIRVERRVVAQRIVLRVCDSGPGMPQTSGRARWACHWCARWCTSWPPNYGSSRLARGAAFEVTLEMPEIDRSPA